MADLPTSNVIACGAEGPRMTKMRRTRRWIVISAAAGVGASIATMSKLAANSGAVLPPWGETSGPTNLQAGPLGLSPVLDPGQVPVVIRIPDAGVDAEIERQQVVDGRMLDPTGPWVVAWYEQWARAGQIGNFVASGHVDYWDVGPSVFYEVGSLQEGDLIEITGKEGAVYTYAVEYLRRIELATTSVEELNGPDILGQPDYAAVTLITCAIGTFNGQEYTARDIIRGQLVSGQEAEGGAPTASDAGNDGEGAVLAESDTAMVTTEGVNLRVEPSIDADVVAVVAAGTVVTITGPDQEVDSYTWWPVSLDNGTSGWVVADFLSPAG